MSDTTHIPFIRRCFELARMGAGAVSPNPMVGAVLVHRGRIIGEGFHRRYGEAHAEVNCMAGVKPADRVYIPESTLYCSLEPCSHFGKTPPCADLILREGIRRVVISNLDPNPIVAGRGIEKLRAAGVEVQTGLLEAEGARLNRPFFTWITQKRPYIILKWAQSADGFIGKPGERTAISGPAAQRYVHRMRSEADAIMIGAETALVDNPRLDNRLYFGKNPLRVVLDRRGRISGDFHLLDDTTETLFFGPSRGGPYARTEFLPWPEPEGLSGLLEILKQKNRAILLVEGGATLHRSFLEAGWWDEIRVIQSGVFLQGGVSAPQVPENGKLSDRFILDGDAVRVFYRSFN